ncbi:hypothetical protein [Stenotrophobium rhamnosiphilum]|nr:hypothetical protein [Stenotrophobium rhamnosiphilum]
MTNDQIENLIDELNAQRLGDRIFLASLSRAVDRAKVWLNEPQGVAGFEGVREFFFIKNDEGLYVAAIEDFEYDLHAFVKPAYRRQGHLSRAMKITILPKLFQDGRAIQKITFNDPYVAEYCVRNWGFSVTGEKTAEIDLSVYSAWQEIAPIRAPLSWDDYHSGIKVKLNRARLYLEMIKDQLDMAYGRDGSSCIERYIRDLECLGGEVQDLIQNNLKK